MENDPQNPKTRSEWETLVDVLAGFRPNRWNRWRQPEIWKWCETGTGKLLGEEGVASLEHAFLLAGAKSVVASLWTADDLYTTTLMKRMYRHLFEGSNKGPALRQAKLDLLRDFGPQTRPVYWAGFTLIGDASTGSGN